MSNALPRSRNTGPRIWASRPIRHAALLIGLLCCILPARAADFAEYRLKAAFVFNFAVFTDWPASIGDTLQLCIYGPDPFGPELDKLEGKLIGKRSITVRRMSSVDDLANCQIVFISRPVIGNLQRVRDTLAGKPVLTIADSPGAARQGVALNMSTDGDRINFEANLGAARNNRLGLNAKLLRLATEVFQ